MINLIELIRSFLPLLAFFSGPLGGGIFIIFLSSAYHSSLRDVLIIFFFSTLSFIFFDSVLFFLGRMSRILRFSNMRCFKKIAKKGNSVYEETIKPNYATVIFSSKVIYGLGIPTIIYLGRKEEQYKKFILLDSVVNVSIVAFFVVLGVGIGKGMFFLEKISGNKILSVIFIIISLMTVFVVERLLRRILKRS